MSDKKIIEKLGGTTVVAEKLGFSTQRVQNWKKRGIPAKVKLEHLKLFQLTQHDDNHSVDNTKKHVQRGSK